MKERPLFPIYDILEHWQAFAYSEPDVRPIHHALYYALVQMVKKRGGTQRFNLPYTDGMQASSIGSRNTYLTTLRDLEKWGFAEYTPGANGLKAPIVHVKFCASAEHLIDIWRASTYTSADTSAEHIIKEVKRLKEEDERRASALAERDKEIEWLRAELLKAQTPPPPQTVPVAPEKAAAIATTDIADEQHWSVGPLTKPTAWKAICERQGFSGIDFEHYRRQALVAAEDKNDSRTIAQWNSWVRNFLNNQLKNGPLLKPTDGEAARTGVHAPQFEGGYKHEVRADLQAQREREKQQSDNLRIAANLAKRAAEGQQQQSTPTGGAGRSPGA